MKFNGRDISDLEARYHRDNGHAGLKDEAPPPRVKGRPPGVPATTASSFVVAASDAVAPGVPATTAKAGS